MKNCTIHIRYFGPLTDITSVGEESVEIPIDTDIAGIKSLLLEKYPHLSDFIFKVALNEEMVSDSAKVNKDSEISLLPPFAGG